MRVFRHALSLALLLTCMVASAQSVLGKLGQATQGLTIYAKPNVGSKQLYKIQSYEYLVVNPCPYAGWTKVLLSNGKQGFVASAGVAELPYQVSQETPVRSGTSLGSRSGDRAKASIAGYALNYLGTPYKWGGNDPNGGIDCSGFVKSMFGKIGFNLPRTAAEQALVGQPIYQLEDLQAGDRLYFWDSKRQKVGHTGIYMGNGYFVHASSGNKGVATDFLGAAKWQKILCAARR